MDDLKTSGGWGEVGEVGEVGKSFPWNFPFVPSSVLFLENSSFFSLQQLLKVTWSFFPHLLWEKINKMARVRSEKGIGDFGKHYDCAVAEMEISIKTSAHPISPHNQWLWRIFHGVFCLPPIMKRGKRVEEFNLFRKSIFSAFHWKIR